MYYAHMPLFPQGFAVTGLFWVKITQKNPKKTSIELK